MRSMDFFTFFWAEFVDGWSIWNKEKMWSFPKNKLQSPELKCVVEVGKWEILWQVEKDKL